MPSINPDTWHEDCTACCARAASYWVVADLQVFRLHLGALGKVVRGGTYLIRAGIGHRTEHRTESGFSIKSLTKVSQPWLKSDLQANALSAGSHIDAMQVRGI